MTKVKVTKIKGFSLGNHVSAITQKSVRSVRKIKQNEKVSHAQNLGSHDQGQGHNPRSKVCHLQIKYQP